MTELKAISGNEIREDIDYNTRGVDPEDKECRNYGKELCDILYYRKAEADKVIADLEESHKTEVKELLCLIRDKENNFNRAFDSEEKELRHQKHKRCLDKAKLCESEEKRLEAIAPIFDTDKECWEYNSDYWNKWCQRWLELAEKFKTNSTAK